jgi:predicted ATPase/transcriptional regulator with XRE-family HTH domain
MVHADQVHGDLASPPAFATLLRQYRDAAALTQEQLGERSGVSVRAISDLERGAKMRPQRATVQLLAEGLSLTEPEWAALEAAVPSRHRPLHHAAQSLNQPSSPSVPIPPPTNLLPEPTPFIGRRQEMATLNQLLDRPQIRLVTLTGPGGSGKTRLALEAAMARLTAYPDGIFWVSLASLSDSALVAPSIAAVLGITDTGEHSPLETLKRALRNKRLLLVPDNFEHLVDAAPLIGDLLRSCPSLQILVTSRAILHLAAEQEFPVAPLSLPTLTLVPDRAQQQRRTPGISLGNCQTCHELDSCNLSALSQSDAVALFVDRAQAARPDFVLTHENASYVAALCHRLDGLPLALELAAARIRVLPPQALFGRLSRRFDILTGGARDRPTRQQTLGGAIGWSYSLLSPDEQTLFARLSVFVRGWTLEAAEAVCHAERDLAIDVLDGLTSLVEQSLLPQEGESESRFGMLETIREYAAEKLEERGEVQEIQRRHALYFLEFAEGIRPELDGPEQSEGFKRLEEEHNNLRAVIDWACDSGEVEVGLRLAIAAESFLDRGYVTEVGGWFERLLAMERSRGVAVSSSVRTEALLLAALCEAVQGNVERARALAEEGITQVAELRDPREVAYRLQGAGSLFRVLGDHGRASALLTEARALLTELGDKAGLGVVLVNLGYIARKEGDAERVVELCRESAQLSREVGNSPYVAYALCLLGVAAHMLGDLDRARVLCQEALQLCDKTGIVTHRAGMLAELAAIVRDQGDIDGAETLLIEGLQLCRAGVCPGYEGYLALAREALGEERFTRVWEEGRAMTVDQAIAYALEETPGRSPTAADSR